MSRAHESLWKSPLVVAIFAAAAAAFGNAFVIRENAGAQRDLEDQKAQSARILQAIKTGDPKESSVNLRFLVTAGLVTDSNLVQGLHRFTNDTPTNRFPALPPASGAAKLLSRFEGTRLRPYRDAGGVEVIGSDHYVTSHEHRAGTIVIDGKPVRYREGITQAQADALLDHDLAPWREKIDAAVTVPLTDNQEAALTSFAFNVGMQPVMKNIVKPLNAGDYDVVPRVMRSYVLDARAKVIPSLVRRREAEIALWNKR
jgi:GH24 family phage-related lysozyme (muramidase)